MTQRLLLPAAAAGCFWLPQTLITCHRFPPQPRAADPDAPRRVQVGKLTRNVTDAHVKEIFSTWGDVVSARVAIDERVQLSKGYAIVEYASADAAQDAVDHMDGGQLDGNMVT